jgi:DNA-directed RNA polymerase subunit RPC12/RpoP
MSLPSAEQLANEWQDDRVLAEIAGRIDPSDEDGHEFCLACDAWDEWRQTAQSMARKLGKFPPRYEPIRGLTPEDRRREDAEALIDAGRSTITGGDAGHLREFGATIDVPAPWQGGTIFLHYYGCRNCGNAFWTEGDNKRRLTPGTVASCPHCGKPSRIPEEAS